MCCWRWTSRLKPESKSSSSRIRLLSGAQLQAQFRLSEVPTSAAKKKRSSEHKKEDAMPAELQGYVLTQALGVRHQCSVVLQSGRACGGR